MPEASSPAGQSGPGLIPRARALFLDDANTHGCAEVTLRVLQEHFGLPDPADSSPAMALNGGVGYSGGVCGAISGAALAAGRLAGRGLADHAAAKRAARSLVQDLMAGFTARFGATNCRELTGYDFLEPGRHHAFIESGVWRDACMRQIEFAVEGMRALTAEAPWARATAAYPAGDDHTE